MELLDFTATRAPYDRDACSSAHGSHHKNNHSHTTASYAPYSGKETKDYSEYKTSLNSLSDSVTVELEQPDNKEKKEMKQASNCEVWFTARIPGYTAPSFRSFVITRTYRVKVRVGIEVAGKKFELEAESRIEKMRSASAYYPTATLLRRVKR